MITPQDKEFAAFGIVKNQLKAGILIGILTLSVTFNILLVIYAFKSKDELWEKLLQKAEVSARDQADKTLEKPVQDLTNVNARADTVLSAAEEAAKTAKDAGQAILNTQKLK